MHNLAIALKQAGHEVSGSDDEIFDPSRATLIKHGLLPEKEGWNPEKLDQSFDAVILGMHAKQDNPELLKAQALGLTIFSFPEYIYDQSKNKQRIVIAGSHGKTTITAIIIHVLNFLNHKFDYVIGAKVNGIENTVKLSDAPSLLLKVMNIYLLRSILHQNFCDINITSDLSAESHGIMPTSFQPRRNM